MAEIGEVPEDQGSSLTPVPILSPLPLDVSSFVHTPCYCEENVYFLSKKLCMTGTADQKGFDLFVIFISNEEKKIPLWYQKASKRTDGLVIWDYHVICVQKSTMNEAGNARHMVWDLDSSLPFPSPLNLYFTKAISSPLALNPKYYRLFRVVHAPIFLRYFASDRSHMKDHYGNWISSPPPYMPIVAEDGTENNVDEYIRMHAADIVTDTEALVDSAYSNKFGVVISEQMLESFFSQIHQ